MTPVNLSSYTYSFSYMNKILRIMLLFVLFCFFVVFVVVVFFLLLLFCFLFFGIYAVPATLGIAAIMLPKMCHYAPYYA